MADEPKVLFEIDVSKILAKLHLAGVQAGGLRTTTSGFWINTGIKNDDPNAKPENPGKVEFVLDSPQNEFEVGYVDEIEFVAESVSAKEGKEATPQAKALQLISKIVKAKEDTTKKNDKAPIVGGDGAKDEAAENDDELSKEFDSVKKDLEKLKSDNKAAIESDKGINELIDVVMKAKDVSAFQTSADDAFNKKLAAANDANDASKKDQKASDYDEKVQKAKDDAVERLERYFSSFAGKEAVNGDIKKPKMIVISDNVKNSSDKSLVANYEIQPISEAEAAKKKEEYATSIGKKCKQKLCFKVKYNIVIDK